MVTDNADEDGYLSSMFVPWRGDPTEFLTAFPLLESEGKKESRMVWDATHLNSDACSRNGNG